MYPRYCLLLDMLVGLTSHWDILQVDALVGHEFPAGTAWQRVEAYLGTPVSEVDPMDFQAKIESEKGELQVIVGDISDAKRRVTSAKGPKKGRAAKKVDPSSDAEDASASNWCGTWNPEISWEKNINLS